MFTARSLASFLLFVVAACGRGETRTTDSLTAAGAASSTAAPVQTTAASTPEPTPLTAQTPVTRKPEAAPASETPRPTPIVSPRSTLSGEASEVEGVRGTYCWTPDDGRAGTCADAIPTDPDETLEVRRGETLTLSFNHPRAPKSIRIHRYDTPFEGDPAGEVEVPEGNPAEFTAEFPEGASWLAVSTFWDEGDAYYYFEVDVA